MSLADDLTSLPPSDPPRKMLSFDEAAAPLIRGCVYALAHEDLSPAERRAARQKAQRMLGKLALRYFAPERAARVLLDADRQIGWRVRRERARRNLHARRHRRPLARPVTPRQAPRRRERRATRSTRAAPSDDDGPSGPRPPRPSRSRRPSSDLTRYPRRRSR